MNTKKQTYKQKYSPKVDDLITYGQELYYSNQHRSFLSQCAENQRYMVLFALDLLKQSPTTYVRKAKTLLNLCGWHTNQQLFNMQIGFKTKQDLWRNLSNTDTHQIMVGNIKYHRKLSTGLIFKP